MLIETKNVIGWFKLQRNFECDWLIELSDNKLSDNKLSDNKLSDNKLSGNKLSDNDSTAELVENRIFF